MKVILRVGRRRGPPLRPPSGPHPLTRGDKKERGVVGGTGGGGEVAGSSPTQLLTQMVVEVDPQQPVQRPAASGPQ